MEPSDFLKVLGKELRVSAIVGAVLGLVNGLRIYLMYTYLYAGQYDNVIGTQWSSACRCSSASSSQSWWAVWLPLAAKKLGADPAIMATPFITTIVDATSLADLFPLRFVAAGI